jgi:hypothetical protein
MDDYIGDWSRRIKSLRERILLLNVSQQATDIQCIVLSQSDKQYLITIDSEINVRCTCPDFCIRNVTCKHIYWLGYKKMGYKNPEEWTTESVQQLISNHFQEKTSQGRNDTCPICLETIRYNTEPTVCCESECHNAVHKICWIRYFRTSFTRKCVVCRSWSMPEIM